MRQSRMLELIGKLYDAALDPMLWPAVAPDIAEICNSPSTALLSIENGAAQFLSRTANFDETAEAEYSEHYHQTDIWAEGAVQRGLGSVVLGQEIISPAAFAETEFYRDWGRKKEVFHLVGALFEVASNEIGLLGIHRAQKADAYNEDDRARVALFLPHLQRALQVRRRLLAAGVERDAALDALDRSGTATVVAARDGRVVYANRRAEALLRGGNGLGVVNGRLATGRRAATERLAVLTRAAADTAAGQGAAGGGGAGDRA